MMLKECDQCGHNKLNKKRKTDDTDYDDGED